jgi:DNA polymerase (family 10)
MLNPEVADIFERMARVIAFKGGDRFRIMAYERAAFSLRDVKEDVASIAAAGKLKDIPGIGKDLAAMIEEYIQTGRIQRYERERRGLTDELIDLMGIPGLAAKESAEALRRLVRLPDDLAAPPHRSSTTYTCGHWAGSPG